MKRVEIAVRVDHERWKKAVAAHKTNTKALSLAVGKSHGFINHAIRRGGFDKETVAALERAGIHAHEYETAQLGQLPEPNELEDAFVRALERFYGIKEGEYAQWLITTMNAVTKNAVREVIHGAEIPKV